ncbi:hypothetical protein J4E89_004323 [Alternaria sp. Ai002NY15]|nr:hypothetical protein J4E89_004323 [Alternaria sp. Ai002NY15]
MAELERQASLSESPPEPDQVAEAEPTRKTTASGATNKTCIGKSSNHTANTQSVSKKESPRSNANDVDVDAALPNARVVTGTERKVSNTVRQRTTVRKEKRHSSTGSNHHSRTRSDSAVSVGVASSTATARG